MANILEIIQRFRSEGAEQAINDVMRLRQATQEWVRTSRESKRAVGEMKSALGTFHDTINGVSIRSINMGEAMKKAYESPRMMGIHINEATRALHSHISALDAARQSVSLNQTALNAQNVAYREAIRWSEEMTAAYQRLSASQQRQVGGLQRWLNTWRTGSSSDIRNMTRGIGEYSEGIQQAGRATEQWSFLNNSLLRNIYKLRWEIVSITFFVYAFARAIERVGKSAYEGARFNEQAEALRNYAASWQTTSSSVLSDMEQLSGGIISNAEKIKLANKTMLMGFGPDMINTFTQVSRAISRISGEEFEKIFERFIVGTGRANERQIALTGTFVSAEQANINYANSLNRSVASLTDFEKRVAFGLEVQRHAKQILSNTNLELRTQREDLDAAGRAWADFFNRAKQDIAGVGTAWLALKKKISIEGDWLPFIKEAKEASRKAMAGKDEESDTNAKIIASEQALSEIYKEVNSLKEKTIPKEEKLINLAKDYYNAINRYSLELANAGKWTKEVANETERYKKILDEVIKIQKDKELISQLKKEQQSVTTRYNTSYQAIRQEISELTHRYNIEKKFLKDAEKEYKAHYKILEGELKSHYRRLLDFGGERLKVLSGVESFLTGRKETGMTDAQRLAKDRERIKTIITNAVNAFDETTGRAFEGTEFESSKFIAESFSRAITAQMELIKQYEGKGLFGFSASDEVRQLEWLRDQYQTWARNAIQTQGALIDSISEQFNDVDISLDQLKTSLIELTEQYNLDISNIAEKQKQLVADLEQYVTTHIPKITLQTDEAEQALEQLKNKYDALRQKLSAPINVGGTPSGESDLPFFVEETYGRGGIAKKPTVALVGEEEPEYIIPESKMQQFLTNNAFTVNYYGGKSRSRVQDEFELRRLFAGMQSNARISY